MAAVYRLLSGICRWFLKDPVTEWFFMEPKMVLLWHRLKSMASLEEPFEALLFLRVKEWEGLKLDA